MPNYRRAFIPGGTWFFQVQFIATVQQGNPLQIDAWVVLPYHLHCVFTLPPNDCDFSLRWRLIKSCFSLTLPKIDHRSDVSKAAGERGIQQRHFWEHLIKDETDFQYHVDYENVNPLKHSNVDRVRDWPYSTFHRYVTQGVYTLDWCGNAAMNMLGGD